MLQLPGHLLLAALNHLLAQAPWARRSAENMANQPVRIHLAGLQLDWQFDTDGWLKTTQTEPLATLHLPALLLLRLAAGDAGARQNIRVEGDAQLAGQFGAVLSVLSWDAEADLAPLVGDAPAHLIVQAAHSLIRWKTGSTLEGARIWIEYATEESPLLAQRHRVTQWITAVDELRDAVARLDKRLELLARQPVCHQDH